MFDKNVGAKIKAFTTFFFWVGFIILNVGFFIGIATFDDIGDIIYFFIAYIMSVMALLLTTLIIAGFGQRVEDGSEQAYHLRKLVKIAKSSNTVPQDLDLSDEYDYNDYRQSK